MEVWIGLEEYGFLDHLPFKSGSVEYSVFRKKLFELFSLSDKHYKKLRKKLVERKQSGPSFLILLTNSFKSAVSKKA